MSKTTLEKNIQTAATEFAAAIIEAVKDASLQELIDLQGVPAPKRQTRKATAKKPGPKPSLKTDKPRAKRMSAEEKAKLFDSVVEHLKVNPSSPCKAIAAALNVPSRNLGLYLKELKKAGKVTSEGQRAAMKYSVPATKV